MSRQGFALLICVLILFAMGLSMVFNTTAAEVLDRALPRSTHHALIKQLLYALLGVLGAIVVWFVGYEQLLRLSGPLLIMGSTFLVLVFVPGIGQNINGAHRWIGIGGYSLQPSEFVKYLIPMYYIHKITTMAQPILLKDLLKLLGQIAIPLGLIWIEPDNGTAVIIIASLVVLFFLTKIRWVYWGLPILIMTGVGALAASQMPHVQNRIQIFLHPELDLQGKGHQPHQAKIAAGSGGFWGKGLAESMQKLNYLPEARSDYIAAIFAEEFGFVGISLLILIYMFIGYLGFSIAGKADNTRAFYLAAILTFLICFQAFLNLGVVSGLLPSKGTNLPFFSQGGSNLLANFIMVCILLNISEPKTANA
ncbi:MAG: cell division protein FtsW [Verrucomicrobia bacterium]|nr:cell division protein FtsW [Verrucomicrobiota bacterium]